MARIGRARAIAVLPAVVIAVLAGPLAATSAAAPNLTIETPVNGTLTSSRTPTIGGSAEELLAPVQVTIFAGASAGGTEVQSFSAGVPVFGWSGTPEPLGDGQYTALAEQQTLEGSAQSNAVTFTIDDTAPVVSLKEVSSPRSTAPTLEGADSDGGAVEVAVFNGNSTGGTPVASTTVSGAGGSWSWSPSLGEGEYTAQAKQVDDAGNQGFSPEVHFTISTAKPNVSITKVSSPTKDDTPLLTGGAGIAEGDANNVIVIVYRGTGTSGPEAARQSVVRSGGGWGWETPALEDGTYTAQAQQGSTDGETGFSAATTFTIDTVAPTLTIKGPASPSNDKTPRIEGGDSEDGAVTLRVYSGGKATGSPVATATVGGSGGHWSAEPTLSEGEFTAQAEEADAAGNKGLSPETHFLISTATPVVTITPVPSPGNDATPTLQGTAGASGGDHAAVHVTIYAGPSIGGPVAGESERAVAGGAWSYTAGPLADAQYTALVTQRNDDGETGEAHDTFTIDTVKPTVSVNAVQTPSIDTSPAISGTAGQEAGDASSVTVTVYRNVVGGEVAASGKPAVNGGNWSYEPTLGQGSYVARATQTDSAHNEGASGGVAFTIDTTPPSVTIVEKIPSPSNNTEPTLSGGAGVLSEDEPAVQVLVYRGASATGSALKTVAATVSAGSWQAKVPHLEDGQFTAVAQQRDRAGNLGHSGELHFAIDTGKPEVSLASVTSPSRNRQPNLTGKAGTRTGDSEKITVRIAGSSSTVEQAVTASGGGWSYTPAPLTDGKYTAVARQSNVDGETGETGQVAFTVDNVPPAVFITTPRPLLNDSTPTLTGAAGTAEGDLPAVTVAIHRGAGTEGAVEAEGKANVSGGGWSYTPSKALADGTYTAVASQEDETHNRATTPGVTFTLDTVAPSPTITAPHDGDSVHVRPTFTGTATEEPGDVAEVRLTITPINGTVGTPQTQKLAVSEGAWSSSRAPTALANGVYEAVVEQLDEAGNVGAGAPVTFHVNTLKVGLRSEGIHTRGGHLVSGPSPSFAGTATEESATTEGTVTLDIYAGTAAAGTPIRKIQVPVVGTAWSAPAVGPLSDGSYTVEAEQNDSKDGPGVSNAEVFEVDADAPALTMTAPASGSAAGSTVTAAGTAGTAAGDVPSVTVQLFVGAIAGSPVQSLTVPVSAGSWSASFGGLAPGAYTVRALQSDDVGNTAATPGASFTVAGTGAPAPSFTVFPSRPHTGETVSFVSTSSGAEPLSYAWSLSATGAFAAGKSILTTSFTTPGKHTIRLRLTDANGVTAIATKTITVTSTPLTLMQPFPIVRIAGNQLANGARIRLLSVQSPIGAQVIVKCHGPGCPKKAVRLLATRSTKHKSASVVIRLRRFERALGAGAVLEVRVFKAGQIGKYTRFTIRHGKLPQRVDRCLGPTGGKPIACPS
jgi:hypothetical protein